MSSREEDLNIPASSDPRVVVLGAGFGGLTFVRKFRNSGYQVVLIDRNNFHQFQPLFYQVAMAGLEPSAIAFPIRKVFQKRENVFVRQAEILEVDPEERLVVTDRGNVQFDFLVIGIGAVTNFFNNEAIAQKSYSLKTLGESLGIRNRIFEDFEESLMSRNYNDRQKLIDFVIVGGGPTGVEMAGALAEMKRYIIPKDYRELDPGEVDIYLVQSGEHLLPGMRPESQQRAERYLSDMGVTLILNDRVVDYDGESVFLKNGDPILAEKLIWAAGVRCPEVPGLSGEEQVDNKGRFLVDQHCRVKGFENIFAVGDIARMDTDDYPYGHPQVAQVALQMASYVASFLDKRGHSKEKKPFVYKDKGALATIGRNKAVADLPRFSLGGFLAWLIWLWVHLYALIGTRNKLIVVINWMWNYFTYDTALRLIIKQKGNSAEAKQES
ncbi:NAD(P)/FAD-dependent oxidoreductase [Membranihabitans maritimus]|uniref:NAD(P)/FAD-dependent oxidoreductase n=1 Tax=Membranihabitans maritimus TaxID=2904244 RepID=UPI001F1DB08D|nr:NAD(P)/FAD-dependent oxidoreductase [Membranihabitans maritimus]